MYHCILVTLTLRINFSQKKKKKPLHINAYDFIFGKDLKSFAKEIYLYIFINLYFKYS